MKVSVAGQTRDSTQNSPRSEVFDRLVGSANEAELEVSGILTRGLVDTGSMITTVGVDFYRTIEHDVPLQPITDFELDVSGANGQQLPYMGYIEINITVPCLSDTY